MTDPFQHLAAAETRAALAHERLSHTIAQLQARLDPRERAHRAAREARIVGETAAAVVKEQPRIVVGAAGVAAAATLFLARHRIAALFRRSAKDTPPESSGLTPVTRTDR